MRESMILYTAYADKFAKLTDEQFGKLMRGMITYQLTGEALQTDDLAVELAFDVVKYDVDRNNEKYKQTCERRREAGKKGGIAKASNAKQKVANLANASNAKQIKQKVANLADNDNDNDNDNDINNNTTKSDKPIVVKHEPYMVEFDRLWQAYPRKEGRKEAMKAYERSRKAGTTYETIKDGIDRYNDHIKAEKTERRFIMQGSTFFRGERWADTWETSRKTTSFANFQERKYDSNTMLGLIEM